MSTAKTITYLVILFFACAIPAGAQSSSIADVPMLFRGLMPAVEVMINGKGPFLFAIDTGAQGQARVDTSLAARLNLQSTGTVQASDGSRSNPITLDVVQIDSIAFGGLQFSTVTAVKRDYNTSPNLPKIDGVLGFNLFSEYLLTLDYPAKRVRVERGQLPAVNGADILSFEAPRGIPVVEMQIGNLKLKAHLDSGNTMGGFVVPSAVVEKLNLASRPVAVGRARTVSSDVEIKEVRLSDSIKLGRFEFSQPTIAYPAISEDANIGSKILREFALTFDQKNKRVKLERTPAKTPEQIVKSPSSESSEYAGSYGARSISLEDGAMFLQRQGGPKLKLVQVAKDEFTLEAVPGAQIKFVRDGVGKIAELRVLNREGQWEASKKDQP